MTLRKYLSTVRSRGSSTSGHRCPCGYGRMLGRHRRRLARQAMDLHLFLPMLDRMGEIIEFPAEEKEQFEAFVSIGQKWYAAILDSAHGYPVPGSLCPNPRLLYSWMEAATNTTLRLLRDDPDWYRAYWRGVVSSGYPMPKSVTVALRAVGVLG